MPHADSASTAKLDALLGLPNSLIVSELRYRRLFESARDGILILDGGSRTVTDANPFMTELLGYTRDELIGKELWEIGLIKDKESSQNALRKLVRDGYLRYEDLPLKTRDGKSRAVEVVSNLYLEDQRLVIQFNIRDITERRRLEISQHASERQAQATLDALSASIAILDRDGAILAVNENWRKFGSQNARPYPDNLDNTAIEERNNYLTTCDRAEGDQADEAAIAAAGIRSVIAGATDLFTMDYPCDSPYERNWYALRVTPFPAGSKSSVVVSHENITERINSERAKRAVDEKLIFILESIPDAFCAVDTDWCLTYVNAHFVRLSGRSAERLIGAFLWNSFPAEIDTTMLAEACQKVTDESTIEEFEQYYATQNQWLEVRVFRSPNGVSIYFHDISARKQADADRLKLEDERQELLVGALERADRDSLTGLLNHRAFQARIDAEAARCEREGTYLGVVMMDLDNFKFFNDVYGHSAGDKVLRLVADKLVAICRSYDSIARFGGDEFAVLLPSVGYATAADVESRIRSEMSGLFYHPDHDEMPIPVTLSIGAAMSLQGILDRNDFLHQADLRMQWFKTGGAIDSQVQSVRTLVNGRVEGYAMLEALVVAVDNKDRYTRQHSEDVMGYSLLIADRLKLDEAAKYVISVGALIHDVGKIGVPDSILRKPGSLTIDEFEAIKQHSQMGYVIVSAVPGLEQTLDIVRHHHERWDGGGYPSGLQGEHIPFFARLLAVADSYSAMTTDRPYRKGMTPKAAIKILLDGAGKQWDDKCVAALCDAMI